MWRSLVMILVMLQMCGWQAFAHEPADGKIHAAIGPYILHDIPYHHVFTSPFMEGLGVLAEGDIDNNGGLEIGLFYFPQYFSIYRNGQEITERAKRIYITMGYRHWLTAKISGALSFFSSYSFGEPDVMHNDFGNEAPYTSAHDMTEYGVEASLQYEFWNAERFSLLVDGRYSYCLTPKSGEDENFFGVLLALKYFVQGR